VIIKQGVGWDGPPCCLPQIKNKNIQNHSTCVHLDSPQAPPQNLNTQSSYHLLTQHPWRRDRLCLVVDRLQQCWEHEQAVGLSLASVIELKRPGLRKQQERKLGRTPHDTLEIAATCIHVYTWVDERMKYGFSCGEGLRDAATTRVVLIKLVSVFLLEQRA
jgi:hypothetical protein